MYDSTAAADIPASAEMVAGYIDGLYRWTDADWARFSHAVRIRIAVKASTNDGDVLDVEPGDAGPADAPGWIRRRQAAGYARPTIYCMASAVAEVRRACAGLDFDLWVAHYTGVAHAEPGAAATQYANPTYTGAHYDLSLVTDDGWPHRLAAPETKEPAMHMFDPGDGKIYLVTGDTYWHVPDEPTFFDLAAAGIPAGKLKPATWAALSAALVRAT